MFALIRSIIFLLIVFSLTVFWSSIVFVRTLIRFIRHPNRYRFLKPRPDKPSVLTQFRHGFLNLPNEIRIHYVEGGDPKKRLILFLHGFPEFWYSWRHQLRELQNEFYVVALDLRGYGESSRPEKLKDYKTGVIVDDVRLVLSELGKSRCVLVGHDWGGLIAWRLAIQYPQLVDKLIILNSPHPKAYDDSLTGLNLKQWLRSWYIFYFLCPYLPEIVFRSNDMKLIETMLTKPPSGCNNENAFTEEDIEAWKYTFQQPGAMTAALNYYRASVIGMSKKRELKAVEQNVDSHGIPSAPFVVQPTTLLIWGTSDLFLGIPLAHGSLQYCQKGTLRLIEGASHWVQQDRPNLVNQIIRDFLISSE